MPHTMPESHVADEVPSQEISGGPRGHAGNVGSRLAGFARGLLARLQRRRSATHVGTHLAVVVLVTGVLTFTVVGVMAVVRLRADATEQAESLSQLSRRQVATKLSGEARLAEARLRILFEESQRQTRYLSERQDVVKATVSANNVAIEQLLRPASVTAELDTLLVTDARGTVIGASHARDLLTTGEILAGLGLRDPIQSVIAASRRNDRKPAHLTVRLTPEVNAGIGLPPGRPIARVAIEPVFDDFGDVAGTLIGIRTPAATERTFEQFSKLVNAGVVVADGPVVVSTAGPPARGFTATVDLGDDDLIESAADNRIGRCVPHDRSLMVCAHVPASEIEEAQTEMRRLSERQAGALFGWFLILGAGALGVLVTVVLLSVRRATRGLPELASAASAVARGNLEVPFRVLGIGEVRGLGQAFEVMLANLRDSMGRIRELAYFDPVTGLPNRARVRLDGIEMLADHPSEVVFLFVDLDRFKSVNDTFGHKAGDELLEAVAKRIRAFLESELDVGTIAAFGVGRLGGDEFLIILRGALETTEIRALAEALIRKLNENVVVGGAHLSVGASIGVARGATDGDNYDTLLMSADVAMYEAKRTARNSCAFFTTETSLQMQERLAIEQELRVAVKADQLSILFQPIVSLEDGRIVAAEALVRWTHPVRGNVSPAKFIGIAEDAGLIGDVGRFVLRRALAESAELVRRAPGLSIAVNVSALELETPTFAPMVEDCLRELDFPPGALDIEITESVAMRGSDAVLSQIARLRQLGVRFSIDDFGTGYSNLSMLAALQVDTLKIDRSLVAGVHASSDQQAIVRSILSLARSLRFSTVVEGVENAADLDVLMTAGADLAQGYYFSRPVPLAVVEALHERGSLRNLAGPLDPKIVKLNTRFGARTATERV